MDNGFSLIGHTGQLGQCWQNNRDVDVISADFLRPSFDIPHHSLVVNCAAYTAVDQAETDVSVAEQINATAVGILAEACRKSRSLLVHYSTDYCFDGLTTEPYSECDLPCPLGVYGKTKSKGDQWIAQSGCEFLILRVSWLYSPYRKNFVKTVVGRMRDGKPLKIVNDQVGCPTSATYLVEITCKLLKHGARGIWNVTDGGACSWYDVGCFIAEELGTDPPLSCSSLEYPMAAPRPAFSVLSTKKLESVVGALPGWQSNLRTMLREL